MASSTSSIPSLLLLLLLLLFTLSHAATFDIVNQCTYTNWAWAWAWASPNSPGDGRQLDHGQTWTVTVNPGTPRSRIWARTGCNFDASGNGNCQSGDCGGKLACTSYGSPPNTLAEFALNQNATGYHTNLDFMDISLVQGFNVPMVFRSISASCSRDIRCTADTVGQCPRVLKVTGGCDDPCTIFKTDPYCCPDNNPRSPRDYSKYFKGQCLKLKAR